MPFDVSAILPHYEPIFIAYASIIIMAVIPIYYGSKLSVVEGKAPDAERVSKSDAYWFPVIGSCVLFGFYMLFNYFSKKYINYLLTAYFAAFGCASLVKLYTTFGKTIIPERWYMFDYYRVLMERKRDGMLFDVKITWLHALATALSLFTTGYYVMTKNWISSNIFGEAFAVSAISLIQLDTFATGMILLAGLFVYDVFWVFGTDVMVSVAKSFDVPVKLLFPRDILNSPNANFTMLGLGDIVIPGVFIALCLKFDHHLVELKKLKPGQHPYFTTAMVFYIIGLVVTMVVMHTYKAAQPALLYLSPAGILSVLLTAIVRGELGAVFAFTTEPVAEKTLTDSESGSESDSESGSESDSNSDADLTSDEHLSSSNESEDKEPKIKEKRTNRKSSSSPLRKRLQGK